MSNIRQYSISIAAATGNTDLVIATGMAVTGFHVIKTNGAGTNADSIRLYKISGGVSASITTVVLLDVADQVVIGPSTLLIDDSTNILKSGDTLRITAANGSNCSCICLVTGIPNLE